MLLIYGATGYTGALIAAEAKRRGLPAVLAGRSAEKLRALAAPLGLEWRAFGLEAPNLDGAKVVLHCAGPFSATSATMVSACLRAGVHYLDITGEVDVFEAIFRRDGEAKERGVGLLPGTGFDVVPSDCLAKLLAERLPGARTLELAFAPRGGSSPGTLKTMVEGAAVPQRVRRGGALVPGFLAREIPFADRPRRAMSISWGDLSTAFRSTGIPDITVYLAARPSTIRAARLAPLAAPVLGLAPVQRFLKARIERSVRGPGEEARRSGGVQLWGRVSDGARSIEATMQVPDGYTFTADAALACALRALSGQLKPGAATPSLAFGSSFAESLSGVRVTFGSDASNSG